MMKKQICGCLGRGMTEERDERSLRVMNVFVILITLMVSQIHRTHVKPHQMVYFNV